MQRYKKITKIEYWELKIWTFGRLNNVKIRRFSIPFVRCSTKI